MVWPPDHAQASTAGRLPSSVTVDRVADIPGGRYRTQRPSVGGGQHEVSEKRIIAAIDCMLGWKLISTRFLARFLTNQGLIDALGVGIDHGERARGSIRPGWDAHTPLKSALPSVASWAELATWGRVRYKWAETLQCATMKLMHPEGRKVRDWSQEPTPYIDLHEAVLPVHRRWLAGRGCDLVE